MSFWRCGSGAAVAGAVASKGNTASTLAWRGDPGGRRRARPALAGQPSPARRPRQHSFGIRKTIRGNAQPRNLFWLARPGPLALAPPVCALLGPETQYSNGQTTLKSSPARSCGPPFLPSPGVEGTTVPSPSPAPWGPSGKGGGVQRPLSSGRNP